MSKGVSLVGIWQENRALSSYLSEEGEDAVQRTLQGWHEVSITNTCTESLRNETEELMEEVVSRDNLKKALKRVVSNKGAPGVDGMTVGELRQFLKLNWLILKDKLLKGDYYPSPVKRVEIPKPSGGIRKLGIPTVLDRFIQQALLQVLQRRWDKSFSNHSYGFRPKRSAHQAIKQAQVYVQSGYTWTVDIDFEQFFDRVNHDRLMNRVARDVKDVRVLKLIRRFLKAGVMEHGVVSPSKAGTPQGGPLSPLLSNLVLDELDKELEARGHRFVRYADDCQLYVKSEVAGLRVMSSLKRFIACKLKLQVNEAKSEVGRPWKRKFLGFTFGRKYKQRKLSSQSLKRFKHRVRRETRRTVGRSLRQVIASLNTYFRSWMGYFKIVETTSDFKQLDKWIRHRLRALQWKHWGRRGYRELRKRGVSIKLAWNTSKSAKGWWRLSQSPALYYAMPNKFFSNLGLLSLSQLQS